MKSRKRILVLASWAIFLMILAWFFETNSYLLKLKLKNLVNSVRWWRRQWQPTPVLLPGGSHGWSSLVGCCPWVREELDTTERLPFHFSHSCIGEGNGNPLQCSCLENPRDRGAWWAAIYGIAQSWTQLKRLSSSSSSVRWCDLLQIGLWLLSKNILRGWVIDVFIHHSSYKVIFKCTHFLYVVDRENGSQIMVDWGIYDLGGDSRQKQGVPLSC